jgi:hypothetical protein
MFTWNVIFAAAIVAAVVVWVGRAFTRGYMKFYGDRLITCPDNKKPAGVRVDASHAFATSLQGRLDLHLNQCSRWPEMQDCGQDCLRQVEESPEDCLVRRILSQWYEGKKCVTCGKPIGEVHLTDHQPALLSPEHRTVEWQDLPPETVPEVLRTHQPLCWSCHVVNRVMDEHPELVVNRSRHI